MEFRRINGLPPVRLRAHRRAEAGGPSSRSRRHRPRLRQSRPPVARPRGREAGRGRPQPAEPPLLARRGASPSCARPSPLSTCAKFGVELDPETEVVSTIGAKEGLLAPHVGAGRARATPRSCPRRPTRSTSRRPLFAGADVRQVRLTARRPSRRHERARPGRRLLRRPHARLGGGVAEAPGHRPVVPAQPHHRLRRPRVHGAPGRVRPRARDRPRPRLRLRRLGFDGYEPAVDPPGARGQGRRGRALHADQVVLHGRLARRLPASATPRSSRRSPS